MKRKRESYCPRQCCCLQARRRTVVRGLPLKEKEVIDLRWRQASFSLQLGGLVGHRSELRGWAVVKSQAGLPSHLLLVGQHRIKAALSTQKEGGEGGVIRSNSAGMWNQFVENVDAKGWKPGWGRGSVKRTARRALRPKEAQQRGPDALEERFE